MSRNSGREFASKNVPGSNESYDQRVGERVALHQHPLAGVSEQPADRHDDHGREDRRRGRRDCRSPSRSPRSAAMWSSLRTVRYRTSSAAMGRTPAVLPRCAAGRRCRKRRRAVCGHAGEPARRLGRGLPHRLEVVLGARDDAAHEGHHEEDVDRGEPDGRVDVEQLHGVEELSPRTVLLDERSTRRRGPGCAAAAATRGSLRVPARAAG